MLRLADRSFVLLMLAGGTQGRTAVDTPAVVVRGTSGGVVSTQAVSVVGQTSSGDTMRTALALSLQICLHA